MRYVRAYLDNDVASGLSQRDLKPEEMQALDELVRLHKSGDIRLGTSRQSYREMDGAPKPEWRERLRDGIQMVDLLRDDHIVLGFSNQSDPLGGMICSPLVKDVIDDPLYKGLVHLGLKKDDAHHFMYAACNGYDAFLTLDRNFRSRSAELLKLCPSMTVRVPSALLSELRGSGSAVI